MVFNTGFQFSVLMVKVNCDCTDQPSQVHKHPLSVWRFMIHEHPFSVLRFSPGYGDGCQALILTFNSSMEVD